MSQHEPPTSKMIPVKFIVNQAQEKAKERQDTTRVVPPDIGKNSVAPATPIPTTTQANSQLSPPVSLPRHEYKEISPQYAVCQICNKPEADDAHIAIGYDAGPSHPGGMNGMEPALPTTYNQKYAIDVKDLGYSTDVDELNRLDNPITQTEVTVFSPGQSFNYDDTQGARGTIQPSPPAPAVVREGKIEIPYGMEEVVDILGEINTLIDSEAVSPEEAEAILSEATELLKHVTTTEGRT